MVQALKKSSHATKPTHPNNPRNPSNLSGSANRNQEHILQCTAIENTPWLIGFSFLRVELWWSANDTAMKVTFVKHALSACELKSFVCVQVRFPEHICKSASQNISWLMLKMPRIRVDDLYLRRHKNLSSAVTFLKQQKGAVANK